MGPISGRTRASRKPQYGSRYQTGRSIARVLEDAPGILRNHGVVVGKSIREATVLPGCRSGPVAFRSWPKHWDAVSSPTRRM
jgi:hypothetical protein